MLPSKYYVISAIKLTIIGIFLSIGPSFASSYTEDDFKGDWSSPFKYQKSRRILAYGSALTGLLVINRENFVDPLQEDFEEEDVLGGHSKYGDYAGQMIPNLAYMSYMYFDDGTQSKRRAKLMLKATAFSGMSVFFLKRIINQKRPDGGDRNSHPSGHTTTAFAFASVISLEHPNWSIPAYALATFVGLSRMDDNVHYLHDVVMGATIGSAFGYALHEKDVGSDTSVSFMPLGKDGLLLALQYRFF